MPLMCCSSRPSRAKEIGAGRWLARAVGVAFVPALPDPPPCRRTHAASPVDQSGTAIDVPLALQSATLDLTQLGFNASVDKGPWTWAIALVHGFGKITSSRDTGAGFATAGYNGHIDGALTELSYYWSMDQSRIVPKAAFEYVRASTGSFLDVGGLNPAVASA